MTRKFFDRLALIVAIAALAFCVTAHAKEPTLNVSAIAGHPAIVSDLPALNVSAIARTQRQFCECETCSLKVPHRCGDPGCVCDANCTCKRTSQQTPPPPLNLTGLSPKRKVEAMAKTEPKAKPRYELRDVCNGRYCVKQWVLVQ